MNDLIKNLVLKAFRQLVRMESEATSGEVKLIYPYRRVKEGNPIIRHSEQEFKQLFIDAFTHADETKGLAYSVETPTRKGYLFKDKSRMVFDKEGGTSGNFDLCIHQHKDGAWRRLHLIEFKAHNVPQEDIETNLFKLAKDCPEDSFNEMNYFIQVIYSANSGTISNLQGKYKELKDFINKQGEGKPITVFILFVHGDGKEGTPGYAQFDLQEGFSRVVPL